MMKFGKFKNLQHVSTHLPQINIPRAKKLLINTFQQFLLDNPPLIEELKEYYFQVIKIASQRSYEELELLSDYLLFDKFYQWCICRKSLFYEVYREFEGKTIIIRSDCLEDKETFSSAGLFNSVVVTNNSCDSLITRYCELIESFFSLRTIYQLNLDKTISFENYIQSIDVFFQEFLESNEDISDQVFPELDLGTIDLIFEQIELLADLFKIPIDSEWVLETSDNLKISIVGFNSNNKTEFSCAFGLGKIVGKTSAYTTYYRYREKSEIFFDVKGKSKKVVNGAKLFLVQARKLHTSPVSNKSLISNKTDQFISSNLLSYYGETYSGKLLLSYDVITAWDCYIKNFDNKPIVVVLEGNGFEHEILRFRESGVSVYKVSIEKYVFLQRNSKVKYYVSDHVLKNLIFTEYFPQYKCTTEDDKVNGKLFIPSLEKKVHEGNFSVIDRVFRDFLDLNPDNSEALQNFLENIPSSVRWKESLVSLDTNYDLDLYKTINEFLLADDCVSILFEYKQYLLKHRVNESFYYYQEKISDDILEMIARDYCYFNLDKNQVKNLKLKQVQSFYEEDVNGLNNIDNRLKYIELIQKVKYTDFFKKRVTNKKYKFLELVVNIESGLFYDEKLVPYLLMNYFIYDEKDIEIFLMLQNYGLLDTDMLKEVPADISDFKNFINLKSTFDYVYKMIEKAKDVGQSISSEFVYQNCRELLSLYKKVKKTNNNIYLRIFSEEYQKNIELCDLYAKQIAKEFVDDIGEYKKYRTELLKWFSFSKYFVELIDTKYRENYLNYCSQSFTYLKTTRNTSMVIGYGYDKVWYNEIKKEDKSQTNLHKLHNIIHQIQLKAVNEIDNSITGKRINQQIPILEFFRNFKCYLSRNYLKIFFDLTIHKSEIVYSQNYLSIEYTEAPRGKEKGHDKEHIARLHVLDKLLTLLAKHLELPYFSEIKYSLTNYRLIAKVEFENSMLESLKNQLLSDLILLINLTFDFSKVDNNKVFSFISKIDYTLLRELLDSTIEIMNNAENINYEKLSKLFTIISQDENIFENLQNSKRKKKILLSIIK